MDPQDPEAFTIPQGDPFSFLDDEEEEHLARRGKNTASSEDEALPLVLPFVRPGVTPATRYVINADPETPVKDPARNPLDALVDDEDELFQEEKTLRDTPPATPLHPPVAPEPDTLTLPPVIVQEEEVDPFSQDYPEDIPAREPRERLQFSDEAFFEDPSFGLDDLYSDTYEGEDIFAGFNIEEVLSLAIDRQASDIHIVADTPVVLSIRGEIVPLQGFPVPSGSVIQRVEQAVVSNEMNSIFTEELELDVSFALKQGRHAGRSFRLNVIRSFGEVSLTLRVVNAEVPSPESLGLPPEIISWTTLPSGLVMMNGPTGTGKSTSIASLVRQMQRTRAHKIITLEKPIEFIYPKLDKGLVVQREIGRDSRSFAKALDSAMRGAPDIIVVGEVRNREEVDALLRAAESGHLAVSTMHCNSPATTISRIMSIYEGEDRSRVLNTLGDIFQGFANQQLLKTVDGKGRFAVHELLPATDETKALITAGNIRGIEDFQIREGRTMEHQLASAAREGRCTLEEAASKAANLQRFEDLLAGRKPQS